MKPPTSVTAMGSMMTACYWYSGMDTTGPTVPIEWQRFVQTVIVGATMAQTGGRIISRYAHASKALSE